MAVFLWVDMLEKPDLEEDYIAANLQRNYGLVVEEVEFLPLGADINTAVYRINTKDKAAYFLKLRSGRSDETAITLHKFLGDLGIPQIFAPLMTRNGRLWGELDQFKTILYPFIIGKNGYETEMTPRHWLELGSALKRVHTASLPKDLAGQISQEHYSAHGRENVKQFIADTKDVNFIDPTSSKMVDLLQTERATILDLIERAEKLASALQKKPPEFTLCHSDIHAGNILIADEGPLYIVDWDEPIMAPKERDLMYIGGALMASILTPQEEERLFYAAYGRTEINYHARAYYRYERIIQDIAEISKYIFSRSDIGQDRDQFLYYAQSNFLPGNAIENAYQSDMISYEEKTSIAGFLDHISWKNGVE